MNVCISVYLPSLLNLISEIEEIISLKKDLFAGSSTSSKTTSVVSIKKIISYKNSYKKRRGQKCTFCVVIAQGGLSHVRQLDGSFAAAVHKNITMLGVEFSWGNDLCQLLHVGWLDINNVSHDQNKNGFARVRRARDVRWERGGEREEVRK